MAKVDFFIQGKGGVSKSACATTLFQYYMARDIRVSGVDTDPTNQSLWAYTRNRENIDKMDVIFLDVYDRDTKILDEKLMDDLVNNILDVKDNSHVIVDVGSSIFPSFMAYLKKYETVKLLIESGHDVLAHMPVVADDLEEILKCIKNVAETIPDMKLCFWLNPYVGNILKAANSLRKTMKMTNRDDNAEIGATTSNGTIDDYSSIEQISIFEKLLEANRVKAFINVPDLCLNPAFRDILGTVFSQHYAFRTILEHDPTLWGAMPNQRVRMFWRDMQDELDVKLCD